MCIREGAKWFPGLGVGCWRELGEGEGTVKGVPYSAVEFRLWGCWPAVLAMIYTPWADDHIPVDERAWERVEMVPVCV